MAAGEFSRRCFGLDLMRAVAALLVVLSHCGEFFLPLWPGLPGLWFVGGLGVDLFFVLSGYLVGGLLIDAARAGHAWIGPFWLRRWWRTLPSFYLFLLINVLLAHWIDGAWMNPLAHVLFVQNLAWVAPEFFPEAWSLAIEEWFYLLAPLAFLALGLRADRLRGVLAFALALLVLGLALRIGAVWLFDPAWDDGIKRVALMRVDAIAWGLAAVAAMRLWPGFAHDWRRTMFASGISIIAAAAALAYASVIDQSFSARVFVFSLTGLGAAALLPWLVALNAAPWRAATRAIFALAIWSYALYLVHMPVLRIWQELLPPPADWSSAWLQAGIYLALSITAAALTYVGFERPVLRWRDRHFSR